MNNDWVLDYPKAQCCCCDIAILKVDFMKDMCYQCKKDSENETA